MDRQNTRGLQTALRQRRVSFKDKDEYWQAEMLRLIPCLTGIQIRLPLITTTRTRVNMKITETKRVHNDFKAEGRPRDKRQGNRTTPSGFIDQTPRKRSRLSGVDYIAAPFTRAGSRQTGAENKESFTGRPAPQARKILDTAGFSSIIPVFDTIEEACGKLVTQNTNDNSAPDKLFGRRNLPHGA